MALYPKADWRPVPAHGGEMTAHLGLVLHVQVGSNSCFPEFDNVKNEASSTWWARKQYGGEQYVDSDEVAWAEAQGNAEYDSVETEGVPGEALTDDQIQWLAELYAWGHAEYGWPFQLAEVPGQRGFAWHGMGGAAWGGHYGCPGDIRKAQRQTILNKAQGLVVMGDGMARFPNAVGAVLVPGSISDVWVVGSDGGVGAFGHAPFLGSMGNKPLNAPVSAIVAYNSNGYWLLGKDGGIFAFGDAPVIAPYAAFAKEYADGQHAITGGFFDGSHLGLIADDGDVYRP